jgi:uncharacterized protein involved in exopolysaccharide biosynthesis
MSEQPLGSDPEKLRLDLDKSPLPTADDRGRFADPPVQASKHLAHAHVGYGGAGGVDEVHAFDYLRMLHKRRWTVITAFVIVFGSVAVYTFTATPIYSARAQVLIENENPNVVKFEEVYEQNKTTNDYYQTQYRILQSRALARRTIDAAKLWEHPLFNGSGASPSGSLNPASWLNMGAQIVRGWFDASHAARTDAPSESESATQSRIIDAFLRALTIAPVRNSRLVDIAFRSPDAELASRLANTHAKQYIEQNLEFKFLATKEATDFLNARTAEQRKALEQSEQALQRYREQTGAVALEDRQNIVVQRLADLNAAVTRARTDRIEKESIYNQIRAIQNDRAAVDTFPAVLNNTFN